LSFHFDIINQRSPYLNDTLPMLAHTCSSVRQHGRAIVVCCHRCYANSNHEPKSLPIFPIAKAAARPAKRVTKKAAPKAAKKVAKKAAKPAKKAAKPAKKVARKPAKKVAAKKGKK
jgi:hypothetical protein